MNVIIETSEGVITAELDEAKAPVTVENFLKYADEKFYDGTIFHRVIKNFMVQGGGFTADMKQKETHEPIVNEAGNGLTNQHGALAMARTSVVNSATSQFFINTVDNTFLNHRDETPSGFGYAVFGHVVDGLDVLDRIRSVPTRTSGHFQDVPSKPVTIKSIRRAPAV
jgi:peptidyl-prolyl cis-trans isomerase B (cyclophilin B)